jgi:FkbM family methyltransferase
MSMLLRAVRRLATLPLFHRLTQVAPLLRLSYALRASLVRERWQFVRNELRSRSVTASYGLRESGVRVALRHHTGDVMVLDEIFSQREYDPPEPVADALPDSSAPLVVADLGANIGLFGAWILGRFPNARIVAFEADPANATVHRRVIVENGNHEQWKLVEAFAAPQAGAVEFTAGAFATSHESRGEESVEVEAVDVFEHLAEVTFLKIDIEGAEWPLLADPRFTEIAADVVVLEHHREGCPDPDPASAAERRLVAAGYDVVRGGVKEAYGAGVLWGVRRSAQRRP